MNNRIYILIVLLLATAWPGIAMAKISAYHTPGAIVIGPSTDTCNATTNVGAVAYTTTNDTLCYCDGLLWKAFPNGPSNYGLRGYWQLNSDASDKTGNGNTGTTHGTPTFVAGEIGNAISLNGTSKYASVPDSTTYFRDNNYTIAAWVNLTSVAAGGKDIFTKGDANSTAKSFELFYSSGFAFNSNGTTLTGSTAVVSTWYHVAATRSGTKVVLYINGVQNATSSGFAATTTYDTTPVEIGAWSKNNGTIGQFFPGMIDDVRYYNRALSAIEIANIYAYTGACP